MLLRPRFIRMLVAAALCWGAAARLACAQDDSSSVAPSGGGGGGGGGSGGTSTIAPVSGEPGGGAAAQGGAAAEPGAEGAGAGGPGTATGNTPGTGPAAAAPGVSVSTGYGYIPVTVSAGAGAFGQKPLRISLTVQQGYDDNVLTTPKKQPTPVPTPKPTPIKVVDPTTGLIVTLPAPKPSPTPKFVPQEKIESLVTQVQLGVQWAVARARTLFSAGLSGGIVYYFDRPDDKDDFFGDLDLLFVHRVTPKLRATAAVNAIYRANPDFGRRYTPSRTDTASKNDYVSIYARLAGDMQWFGRFSTRTSYNLTSTLYMDKLRRDSNIMEHTVGNEFRYQFSPRTTAYVDYRYQWIEYKDEVNNSTSHFLLAGVDYSFTKRLNIDLRAGQQYLTFDQSTAEGDDSKVAPYSEALLSYDYGKGSTVQWSNRLGIEGGSPTTDQTSMRSSLTINHVLTARLSARMGVTWNRYLTSYQDDREDQTKDEFRLELGLQYYINPSFVLNASYTYEDVFSDVVSDEYRRNRIFFGGTYTF